MYPPPLLLPLEKLKEMLLVFGLPSGTLEIKRKQVFFFRKFPYKLKRKEVRLSGANYQNRQVPCH